MAIDGAPVDKLWYNKYIRIPLKLHRVFPCLSLASPRSV